MSVGMFRADQLGSLLRPDHLIEAREAFSAGRIDAEALGKIEDDAVLQAMEAQQRCGIHIFVDGEFRRTGFMTNLADNVDGFERSALKGQQWRQTIWLVRKPSVYRLGLALTLQPHYSSCRILPGTAKEPASHASPRLPRRRSMRLTAVTVEALTLDSGVTDRIVFDDDVPGFGIRIRASGKRSWIYQYKIGGRTRRLVLGQVSAIKLAKARDIASELHAKVRLGGDPASEKRAKVQQSRNTFGSLAERFLDQYRARPRTRYEVVRHLQKYAAPLRSTPVDAITLRDVADLLAKIDKASGGVTANRVRATLSALFSWAMREGLVLSNPVINTSVREERPRDRVLSSDELRRIWIAAGGGAYGTIVRLLILTGQRRSEIGGLSWSEVDLERHTINLPAERTKNKRPHVVPLAPTARALLEGLPRTGDAVLEFTAWAYNKDVLDKRSGVSGWVIHDIRRTVATHMADIGIAPHIIEAILNHVSGHKGGVAGIYNRSSYTKEKLEALTRWDAHVQSIVGGTQ